LIGVDVPLPVVGLSLQTAQAFGQVPGSVSKQYDDAKSVFAALYSCNAAFFESLATLLPKCNSASMLADDSLDLRLDDGTSIGDRQLLIETKPLPAFHAQQEIQCFQRAGIIFQMRRQQ